MATSLSSGRKELLLEQATLRNAVVSRDGSWLAYQSTEAGQSEVYVRPFPRVSDQRWQVSAEGGIEPLWSPQGDELFYRSLDGQLLSVPVRVGPSFVAGEARLLIEARYPVGTSVDGRIYDVSPDGRRFLMVKEGGGKIVVVDPGSRN